MAGCDTCIDDRFDGASAAYRRVLWAVIAINGAMFVVEATAGMLAGSMALRADALDFLGDTLTYGMSLVGLMFGIIGAAIKGVQRRLKEDQENSEIPEEYR